MHAIRHSFAFALLALLLGCGEATQPEESPAPATADGRAATADVDVTAPDLATNDTDYLARLGLIRGHLLVGTTLYRDGATDAAVKHMKHPGDELFAGLDSAFQARGAQSFAGELEALAAAVESDALLSEVNDAYAAFQAAVSAAEQQLNGSLDEPLRRRVVATLLGHAAEEYGIGVVDGDVVEPHEYQDAYGFTQIALDYAERADAADGQWQAIEAAIGALDPLWPDLEAARVEAGGAAQIAAVTVTLTETPQTQ